MGANIEWADIKMVLAGKEIPVKSVEFTSNLYDEDEDEANEQVWFNYHNDPKEYFVSKENYLKMIQRGNIYFDGIYFRCNLRDLHPYTFDVLDEE